MSDRYLYRAKRTGNGERVEGYYLFCPIQADNKPSVENFIYKHWIVTHNGNPFEVDPSTICQCTGLKDKNGKLIWENDIVDFLGHKGRVKYECGSFGITYKEYIDWEEIESNICPVTGCDNALCACENDNYISLWEIYWNFNDEDYSVNTVEVIGNIFDNPELLKEGEK